MNDRGRAWASFGVMIGFTVMLAATSKAKTSTTSSSPSASAAESSSGAPVNMMPADADVVLLTSVADCDKKGSSRGCQLLKDFDAADTYLDLPSSKAVWYGESHGLGGAGDGVVEPFFVNVEKTATGWGVAARSLIPENAKEKKDAADLLAATKAGHALPASEAASFMRTAAPPHGLESIQKTKGRSHVLVEIPHKVYLRRTGSRLLILEYSGSPIGHDRAGGVPATAWIAETWLLK